MSETDGSLGVLFAVIGCHGEYESYAEELCGIFPSLQAAERAISEWLPRSESQNRMWGEWVTRRSVAIASFEPERIHMGETWPGGELKVYSSAQWAEAETVAGEQPESAPDFDEIRIERLIMGEWHWRGGIPVKELTPSPVKTEAEE